MLNSYIAATKGRTRTGGVPLETCLSNLDLINPTGCFFIFGFIINFNILFLCIEIISVQT